MPTIKKEVKKFTITKKVEIVESDSEEISTYEKVFTKEDLEEVFEYGYGFWLRFLRNYPRVLIEGLKYDWSFISRLSKNEYL